MSFYCGKDRYLPNILIKKKLQLYHFIYLVFALIFPFFIQCSPKKDPSGKGKIKIVCTTGMIHDAVKNITRESAEVIALMGPGVDPHLYKTSYKDLEYLSDADIIVYNGLHLEGKMINVLKRMSHEKIVIAASDGLSKNDLIMADPSHTHPDPHIWFDVKLWKKVILYLGGQLAKIDTMKAKDYLIHTNQYAQELDLLNDWVISEINTIPESQRVLITAHDAFSYFGKAYDIEVWGLQGISTLSDFGLNDISSLVKKIESRKIKAVFVESSVSEKSILAVIEGSRSRGHHVKLGGTLFSDALGNKGTQEDNYIGMVKHNVHTIVTSLK